MIIDNKGKLFGKINLVDALVVIFILLVLSGALYRFYFVKKNMEPAIPETINYSVSLKKIRQISVDALNKNDKVYQVNTDTFMGTITNLEVTRATDNIIKTNGDLVKAVVPDRYDVRIDIRVNTGSDASYKYKIKDKIRIGAGMYLKTRMLQFGVNVIDVQVAKTKN